MKTLKNLFLLSIVALTLLNFTKADILPENSHRFDRCVKIENSDEIEGFKLIIWINTVNGYNKIYEVENNTCLQSHYQFGSSTPYLVQKSVNIENLNDAIINIRDDKTKATDTIDEKTILENNLGDVFTRFDTVNPNGGYISNSSKKTYENITYKLVSDNNEYKLIMTEKDHDGKEDSDLPKTLMGYTTNLGNPNGEEPEEPEVPEEPENPQEILENGYTREFNNAYNFAYKNGITTMTDISKANMNGNLNRIAMAKMLSQYAINILNKKTDTTKKCNFTDVTSSLDASYNNGVTLACQLGIMGVNIQKFRPNDTVTRAEFATALSRLLYGTKDGTDQYYSTHLEILNKNGIISNTNPKLYEKRGYVMLMLMRSK